MKGQKGFTLIELMIVVAVIGVLSAIAIPQYQNYVKRSEAVSGLSTLKALLTNYDLHEQETGSAPTGLNEVGTRSDVNPLGTLSFTTTQSDSGVNFKFDGTASLGNTEYIEFTKNAATSSAAATWTCHKSTNIPAIKGC
ncbi:pilin [Photobacterium sp. DNB22_13_2]